MAGAVEVKDTAQIRVGHYLVNLADHLGKGTFGVVHPAVNTTNNENVVSKLIHYNSHPGMVKKAKELYSTLKLEHDNIIQIFGCVEKNKDLYIFMEWCKCDLKRYFKSFKSSKSPNMDIRVAIMLQIAKGLEYLHEINIIHRDMKPANVLVKNIIGNVPNIKLTDFDLSKYIDPNYDTSEMTTDVGTMMFKAPEFFRANAKGKREYHRDVDIYATGLIFLALIQEIETGDGELRPKLETAEEDGEIYDPIGGTIQARHKYKSKFSLNVVKIDPEESKFTSALKELIKKMTQIEPRDRIAADGVVYELHAVKKKLNKPVAPTEPVYDLDSNLDSDLDSDLELGQNPGNFSSLSRDFLTHFAEEVFRNERNLAAVAKRLNQAEALRTLRYADSTEQAGADMVAQWDRSLVGSEEQKLEILGHVLETCGLERAAQRLGIAS